MKDNTGATRSPGNKTPFPNSTRPPYSGDSEELWRGYSSLSDSDINNLASKIVEQVKSRGPFMSLSDFVNRQLSKTVKGEMGALQAAIEAANINDPSRSGAGGVTPVYEYQDTTYFIDAVDAAGRKTTTGIPSEMTQADLLRPLASRLGARTDSFRIRAYGEVRDSAGNIMAQATCEAVVQRIPEFVDETGNAPWDDNNAHTSLQALTAINNTYGRRFVITSFRWLNSSEI